MAAEAAIDVPKLHVVALSKNYMTKEINEKKEESYAE